MSIMSGDVNMFKKTLKLCFSPLETLVKDTEYKQEEKRYYLVNEINFANVKLTNLNAYSANAFSKAFVEYTIQDRNSVPLSWFWYHAVEKILNNYCSRGKYSSELEQLIGIFEKFLKDENNTRHLLKVMDAKTEVAIQGILAHHLFAKLSPSGKYVIDNSHVPVGFKTCPACDEELVLGDTSIGNYSVWYGYPDILIDRATVNIETEEDESESEETQEYELSDFLQSPQNRKLNSVKDDHIKVGGDGEGSGLNPNPITTCIEVKKDLTGATLKEEQAFAETITNAFLQAHHHPELEDLFIPSFIITNKIVRIVMYNCKQDRLYISEDMYLFHQNKIIIGTMMCIWLALNFEHFQNKVKEDAFVEIHHEKSKFQTLIPEETLLIYKEQLHRPLPQKKRPANIPLHMSLGMEMIKSKYARFVNDRLEKVILDHFGQMKQ